MNDLLLSIYDISVNLKKELWPVHHDMSKARFKGSSKTTTVQQRNIPNQTAEEAALQASATNYANSAGKIANATLPNISSLFGRAGSVYNAYNNTANDITGGYSNLLTGNLPTPYATARQQALNADLTGTIGNLVNNIGSRGVLNSSVTGSALDGITRNASDTLARNYSSDLGNYSNLLGVASANNASNLNNFSNFLSSLVGNSDALANNTSDLFNTMYSGRMGTAGATSTTSGGNNGTAQMIGQLGAAAILCFVAGTKISVPGGEKNIEDIQLGDLVYSLNGVEQVVELQEPQISPNDYVIVKTDKSEVRPTATQPFITTEGDFLPGELVGKELIGINGNETVISVTVNHVKETVYDFKTTGENVYFANGFAVRGR